MPALLAVAIFPVLIVLLVALTRMENMLGNLVQDPLPSPLALVPDVLGDASPEPGPRLRLVEGDEHLAA